MSGTRPHPVRGDRTPLPELVHEVVALVVLGQLEERVALDVRDDGVDVFEEVPDSLGRRRREPLALLAGQRLVRDEERRGRLHLRARREDEVRHRERPALGEPAVVVPLAARNVLHGRNEHRDVRAGAGVLFDVRQGLHLVGRREERRLSLQDRPVAVGTGRRLRVEEDARVLPERRVLEVRPDLDRPEQARAAHRRPGIRRARGDEDDRPVVVQPAEELQGLRRAGHLGLGEDGAVATSGGGVGSAGGAGGVWARIALAPARIAAPRTRLPFMRRIFQLSIRARTPSALLVQQ